MIHCRGLFVVCALCALCLSAQAQTVWRCGEGGRSYSESPCPGGRQVNASDPRSAAEVQAARDSITRHQALAARMQKERLAEEQRNLAAHARAANLGPSKTKETPPEKIRPKSAMKARHRHPSSKPADDGTWRAAAVPSRQKTD